jgi:biotin-(acetyl-CoA carboxylase) ligase
MVFSKTLKKWYNEARLLWKNDLYFQDKKCLK